MIYCLDNKKYDMNLNMEILHRWCCLMLVTNCGCCWRIWTFLSSISYILSVGHQHRTNVIMFSLGHQHLEIGTNIMVTNITEARAVWIGFNSMLYRFYNAKQFIKICFWTHSSRFRIFLISSTSFRFRFKYFSYPCIPETFISLTSSMPVFETKSKNGR